MAEACRSSNIPIYIALQGAGAVPSRLWVATAHASITYALAALVVWFLDYSHPREPLRGGPLFGTFRRRSQVQISELGTAKKL